MELLLAILTCYGLTKIVTETYVAKGARALYREVAWEVLPRRLARHCVRWFVTEADEEEPILTDEQETSYDGREVRGYDMISCAYCIGFWLAAATGLALGISPLHWLAIYGGAVFMNTQER